MPNSVLFDHGIKEFFSFNDMRRLIPISYSCIEIFKLRNIFKLFIKSTKYSSLF